MVRSVTPSISGGVTCVCLKIFVHIPPHKSSLSPPNKKCRFGFYIYFEIFSARIDMRVCLSVCRPVRPRPPLLSRVEIKQFWQIYGNVFDRRTDKVSYKDARTHLKKTSIGRIFSINLFVCRSKYLLSSFGTSNSVCV